MDNIMGSVNMCSTRSFQETCLDTAGLAPSVENTVNVFFMVPWKQIHHYPEGVSVAFRGPAVYLQLLAVPGHIEVCACVHTRFSSVNYSENILKYLKKKRERQNQSPGLVH